MLDGAAMKCTVWWVRCREKMPTNAREVLVATSEGVVGVDSWSGAQWALYGRPESIEYWAEFPKHPDRMGVTLEGGKYVWPESEGEGLAQERRAGRPEGRAQGGGRAYGGEVGL